MRSDHLVAEPRCHQIVGLGEALGQQPARPEFTAEFFVVGEVQFHTAAQWEPQRLQRAQGKGECRKVAFADRCGAAIELAVNDLGAIGRVRPAFARGHHIAMGIERHHRVGSFTHAKLAPHDEVGERLQPVGLHPFSGHRMHFGRQAHVGQEPRRELGVRRVIARRSVGRLTHQGLQERHLLVKVGLDPGV